MAEGSTEPRVAQIDVLINGSPVSAEVLGRIQEVAVEDSVELPSMFTFAISSWDAVHLNPSWVDDDRFSVGNVVDIRMGWGDKLSSLIIGEITALEAEFTGSALPLLNVRGYDRRHRLQRGRKTRTFLQKKDSDIAAQIGREAGLTVKATDSSVSLDYVLQAAQTDWEFLRERARLIGYEVIVNDKTMLFRPIGNAQREILKIGFEYDMSEFSARLSTAGQATEVKVQSWSVKEKKAGLGDSKAGDEVSTMGGQSSGAAITQRAFGEAIDVVIDHPVAAQAEADQIAKGRFNELVLELVTGEGVCSGNTDLRAGKVIKIDGVGRRFSGPYYVTSAVHRVTAAGDYITEFAVRRNAS